MQFKYVALAGSLLLAGNPALAAGADTLTGYKADAITAIFKEMGATEMKSELVQDDPRLTFTLEKVIYVIDFYFCEDKAAGCKVLHYASAYDLDPSDSVEAVNAYNSQYVLGKAVFDKGEALTSLRSVMWSPGSSKAQIKNEFETFVGATALLLDHMKKYTVANKLPLAPPFVNTAADGASVSGPIGVKLRNLPRNRR